MNHSQNYKELFKLARELRNSLNTKGEAKEVKELNTLLGGYWSSASELLGDFMIVFKDIRNNIHSLSDEEIEKLSTTINKIEEAFSEANNPE